MKWLKNNSCLLLSIALMLMTLTVFGPLELYFTNTTEFWFDFPDMLKITGIMAGVLGGSLLLIGLLLRGKARKLYSALVFIIALCLYIQGNFLNIDYGILDGKSIDWSGYTGYAIVDTLIWVALIAGLLLLFVKKNALFAKVQVFAPLFIVAVQIMTLGTLLLTSNVLVPEAEGKSYLSTENLFNIGEEENIVVFVLDAFDGAYMEEIFEAEPEKYETIFEDFTYYTNVAAGGATTYSAMPIIITGDHYPGDISYNDYLKTAFNHNGLYTELTKAGYSVNLYTGSEFVPYSAAEYISNLVTDGYRVNSYPGITQKYSSLTAYKYMPHLLKRFFWIYTGDFSQFKAGGNNGAAAYTTDDVWFYETMASDGLEKVPGKTFHMIHTTGSHPPYTMNEFAQRAEGVSILQKSRGQLYIIEEYLRQMKDLGVYDNTTVIITSDHGQEILPRSTMLIKKTNETGFAKNDAPISHFDLHNTFFELIGKEKGDSIFDIEEGSERTRMYYPHSSANGTFFMTEYKITGNPKDSGTYFKTGVVFSPKKEVKRYTLGEQLTFGADGTVNSYVEKGVSTLHVDYSWTDGNEILFKFQLEKAPKKDLTLSLSYHTVYLKINNQRLGIYVDDSLLFDEVLTNPDSRTVTVDIPADLAADKELILKLALPDAKCPLDVLGPGNDPHTLGLALTGLTIAEIDYTDITPYTFGEILTFGANATVTEYVKQGISSHETQPFAFTNGHDVLFRIPFKDVPTTDLQVTLNASSVLPDYGPQQVRIFAGTTVCYDAVLDPSSNICFTVSKDDLRNNALTLKINLPNAVSPYAVTGEGDRRILSLALSGLCIEPVG